MNISDSLENLIDEFTKLPSIGRKTAQRLAIFIIKQPRENVSRFSEILLQVKDRIKFCNICYNITEDETCRICSSSKRDKSKICVVEEPQDVMALERTNEYRGLYHVLHGKISPLDGVGPDDIRVKELIHRLGNSNGITVSEVIFALNPTVEGETTILYLSKLLKPLEISTTRIARGIPIGADLELTDEITLAKAMEGRVAV